MSVRSADYLRRWKLAALLLLAAPLAAQAPRIVGPGGGGAMYHVTINPLDAREVLLSCDMTGAYISHDGGQHWRMFNLRGGVRFFGFDPLQRGTIYAATDVLWRSQDDGKTWQMVWPKPSTVRAILMDSDHADETAVAEPNPVGTITALAVDPVSSKTLFAAANLNSQAKLFESRDAGRTWRPIVDLPDEALHLWVNPHSSRSSRDLYVATSQGILERVRGVWQKRLAPSGVSFSEIALGLGVGDPSVPVAYGMTTGPEPKLMISKAGGTSWYAATVSDTPIHLRAIATSLHHPAVAYVSFRDLQVGKERYQGVARTSDYGKHWKFVWRASPQKEADNVQDAWIAKAMTPAWTEEPLSLTVDDNNPDLAYATDLGRTLSTTDGGRTWTARYSERENGQDQAASWVSTGLDVTTTYGYLFDPFNRNRRFIPTTDIGLFRSEDGGRSWVRSVNGVPERWRNTTYSVVLDPQAPGRMWAAMSGIHDLPRPKMWRHRSTSEYVGGICDSDDGGRTWKASSVGMPETAPTSLLLDPTSPPGHRTLWAATMGHGIYRSEDDGHTWSPANDGIRQPNALGWRIERSATGTLYALIARRSEDGSIGNDGDGALYRSTDRGDHWKSMSLPEGANAPNGIAIDPQDPKRIYLALWARATPERDTAEELEKHPASRPEDLNVMNGEGGGIALSEDGGDTWRWVLDRDRHIYDVTIDPRNSRILYATGFESSAWISRDRGEHWTRIPAFNFKWGQRVQADPEDSRMVYVSTFGGGVWHIPLKGSAARDITTPVMDPGRSNTR
ncbi:MAG TPA: hypothetical protein VFS41_02405 [Edaphobacter sp.]|nr:hypothetical protein [Edaphobacter sp.]